MPQRMVDLLACWRAQFGRHHSIEVWKIILSYLMWCIWKERNDQSFEYCERTMVELKAFFFKTLYHYLVAYNYFQISRFLIFLIF
jgi:hypothetical protein